VRETQVARGRPKSRANPNENECAERKENEERDARDTSKRFVYPSDKSMTRMGCFQKLNLKAGKLHLTESDQQSIVCGRLG